MKRAPGRGLCAAAFLGLALLAAAPDAAAHSSGHTHNRLFPVHQLDTPRIVSSPASGDTYLPGETITVYVPWGRTLSGHSMSINTIGTVELTITVGSTTRTLTGKWEDRERRYGFGNTSFRRLYFDYVVRKGDRDTNGVSLAENMLNPSGTSTIWATAGGGFTLFEVSKDLHGFSDQSGHKVDTPAPTFTGVTAPAVLFYAGGSVNYRLPQVANAADAHSVSYSVTSARSLPTGYTLNASTATITGSYGSALARQNYTLRATDGFNRTADLTFSLEVSADAGIESISITSNPGADKTYGKVAPFGTNDTITVRVDLTHRLTTVLASSVCLDIRIGSNTRRTCSPSYSTSDSSRWDKLDFSYAVQAGDWDGDGISFPTNPMGAGKIGGLRFRLTGGGSDNRVNRNFASIPADPNHKVRGQQTVPSFGSTASPSHSWVKGNAVSQALPAATGGDGGVTYSIEESLPAGLSFAAATRTISGTPTAAQAAANYTLAATDADGDKATLRFSIEIEEITVSIDSPSVTEGDSGSTDLTFTATLSTASAQEVTVDYADAGTGTATSGTDYTAITDGTLTFTAGTTSQTFDVSVTGDTTDEVDETILVTLSNASGATISTATGTGTITDDDDPPTVSVAAASVTEGDSGSTNLTFTATLSAASGKQVTVDWAEGTGGTATSGTDYTAITGGTLTFAAGTTSQTFNVSVTGDVVDESNETVVVTLSSPTNATISATAGSATGTITDDDATPTSITLTVNDDSVGEGDGDTTITVTATVDGTTRFGTAKTVSVSVAGSGTASAVDFAAVSDFDITIAAGAVSKSETFTLSPTDDSVDETDETITVSGTSTGLTVNQDTITLSDDDAAPTSITLSVNDNSVAEDDGATTITVTATVDGTTRFVDDTTVKVSVGGSGTATAVDFASVSNFNIEIAAGEQSKTGTFTLTPTNDTADETDETITVSGTSGSLTVNSATITLTDDDAAPTLSINSPSVSEGDSGSTSLTYTVTLSAASGRQVTVQYADAGTGTATSGTDYTAITGGTLTFTAGTTSQTFNVSVTGDTTNEANETVVVTLSGATNATISNTAGTGTGTITNDDGVTLSINSPSVTEGDSGSTTLTFTATLSAASGQQVTVQYADAGTGTATSGTDYTAITGGTLTFPVGTTSQTFNVSVTGDTLDEANETVVVTLSGATNATISTATGTGTITDNDGMPTLSVSSPRVTEGDSGSTNLTFTVTLSPASGRQVTVNWAEGTGGTATSGTDYTVITGGTLTFAAGTTSQTFDVSVTGDALDEANETVVVTLSGATNATISAGTGTGTITDNDAMPTLSVSSPRVTEGDSSSTNLTFTATLSAASGRQVTVDWAEGTGGTATSGTDYTAITGGTLTFTAGTTSQTFDVSVTGDTLDESNETVVVTLSSAANATISTASGTGTITDDDDAPTLSIDSPSVTEGDSGSTNLTFTVTLSAASGQQVTVQYADVGTGTATSGTDYTAITDGTLTFVAGTTSQTFDVSVTGDTVKEPNETIVVELHHPQRATIAATPTGTGTITDDDTTPGLSISSPRVTEGDSGSTNLTFTVTLSTASTQQVTVAYADAGTGTATSGTDYTAIAGGTLMFTAGTTSQDITVSVTGDTTVEPHETVVVSLSNASGAAILTAAGTGAIVNDDGSSSLSVSSPSVTEASTAIRFTVTLSAARSESVRVTWWDTGEGTATEGQDYNARGYIRPSNAWLTFAPGEVSKTINQIRVLQDSLEESDETIIVAASESADGSGRVTGTATIKDDDRPTLSINSPSVTEGDSGSTTLTFTATLSAASGQQVTVQYADAGTGTATSGTDYTAITGGTLTFTAGTTSQTFDVSVTGDTLDEADETIVVTLSGAANATISAGTGTGTITDDDDAPTLSINSPSVTEGDSGSTTLTFTATLSAASGQQVTVQYADAGTGTATSGTDYTVITGGTLTFAVGITSQTFDVSVTGDTLDEADETVVVTLSSAANATISAGTGTGTITDNDGTPTLSVSSPSVTEGDSGSKNLTFTVTLSPASGQQVTVDWAEGTGGTAVNAK